VGFVLLAAAAVVLVMAFSPSRGKHDPTAGPQTAPTTKPGEAPPVREADATPASANSEPQPPPPTALSEAEQQVVNEAIDRGVGYLKSHMPNTPMGNHRRSGAHSLFALTLLECGVPADDPALARLTRQIRTDAPRLSETYSLSLAILFFDRLGDPQDEPLIRRLAARLIAGQNAAGGWHYGCPALSENDSHLLLSYLETNPLAGLSRANPGLPQVVRPDEASRTQPAEPDRAERTVARGSLPKGLRDLPVITHEPRTKVGGGVDDNSNTQFGVLGVWTARRHGVAVERPLALISDRFHQTQNADGSWGYNVRTTIRRDSMTCAGLLGLAVGRVNDERGDAAEQDPAIAKGLQYLGKKVQKPGGIKRAAQRRPNKLNIGADSIGDLYWLWSIERVGVIYSLQTLGGKDWYAWGAGLLVDHQGADGSWVAGHGEIVDTCFALLFLKRVNVAKDLTLQLQRIGPVRDPDLSRSDK
jgi:hypothetical protein